VTGNGSENSETRFAGRFILEREVGSGGMARVFAGRDEVLNRRVAVKVLYPYYSDTDIGERFRREGRTAARLSHRNIVQVYDAGRAELDGRQVSYIVMEYLPGGDLKQMIVEQERLREREIARIGYELAAGLSHAHERGIIHRDIKPHNVLMDDAGRPKLTDFGIARALDATQQYTRTGSFLGTALYAPPEQLRGEEVTPKSDVYSLGVTLYHAAAGAPPFEGQPLSVARKHESEPPPPPRIKGAFISGTLEALILDCLEKSPEDRPEAAEVRRRLVEISTAAPAEEKPATAPPPPRPAASKSGGGDAAARPSAPRRHSPRRGLLLTGAALLLVAGLGSFALLDRSGPEEASREEAAVEEPVEQDPAPAERETAAEQEPAGNTEPAPEPPEETAEQEQPQDEAPEPPQDSGDPLSEEAAASAVEGMYRAAASEPESSWDFLSSRFQREVAGSRQSWAGTFDTLERIEFVQGPEAEVSGDTARVSFVTRAYHTDRTEENTATWVLINEGGEWKLDDLAGIQTRVVG
jgi:serine/threonine protein kinase